MFKVCGKSCVYVAACFVYNYQRLVSRVRKSGLCTFSPSFLHGLYKQVFCFIATVKSVFYTPSTWFITNNTINLKGSYI
jgi:hypothetical protein